MNSVDLYSLLNEPVGSQKISELLNILMSAVAKSTRNNDSQLIAPKVKSFKDGTVYHSYHNLGISLNYEPLTTSRGSVAPTTPILVAIHLYRHPVDQFETFPCAIVLRSPASLPLSPSTSQASNASISTSSRAVLNMDLQAHEVIQLLGEPEKKTGGKSSNCWVAYHTRFGLGIDFNGKDWDDRDMNIGCLTLSNDA